MLSQILAWLDTHESAISAVVGLTVLVGLTMGGLRALASRGGAPTEPEVDSESDLRRTSPAPATGNSELTLGLLPIRLSAEDPILLQFGEALADDLETFVSRSSFLAVRAADASAPHRAEALLALDRQGVSFALALNLRRAGDRVRTTATLIEVQSGQHLWTDQLDRPLAEIETASDGLAHAIANQLVVPILEEEGRRFAHVDIEDLDSNTLTRLAYTEFLFCNKHNRAVFEETRRLLDRAIELDPRNARALATRAAATSTQVTFGLSGDPDRDRDQSFADGEAAMRLAATDALSLWGRSWPSAHFEDYSIGLPFIERAVVADPNNAHLRSDYAVMLGHCDRVEEGIGQIEAAFRLSPNDPRQYIWLSARSFLELQRGDADRALEYAELSIQFGHYLPAYCMKIIIETLRGQDDRARRTIEQLASVVEWDDPLQEFKDLISRPVANDEFRARIFELATPWPSANAGRETAESPNYQFGQPLRRVGN